MENKTNWWLIIGIVVVVAILASFITLQFTGNAVKTTPEVKRCSDACYYAGGCSKLSTIGRNVCRLNCDYTCKATTGDTTTTTGTTGTTTGTTGTTTTVGTTGSTAVSYDDSAVRAQVNSLSASVTALNNAVQELKTKVNASLNGTGIVISNVSCYDESQPHTPSGYMYKVDTVASCEAYCPSGTTMSNWECQSYLGGYTVGTCQPGMVKSQDSTYEQKVGGSGQCVKI
ncbi:MAG: hypothetical protein WCI72_00075 [archaeon]